jgi:hypothetical protein
MALLMQYKYQLFLCLLALFVFSSLNGDAQTHDSLILPGGEQIQQFLQPDTKTTDTSLQKKNLSDNSQVQKWKESREFSYMRYLDSLLRKQKDLRTDTVSVDEKSGRISRTQRHQRQPSSMNVILNSWPLKLFFWLLAIIFIVFISYKVFFKNGIFASRKPKSIVTNEESLQELNEVSAYDNLISEAENKNEYNLATRYWFLKTLKSLSDTGLIHFTSEKTNKEYLREMEQHNYYDEFRELTRDYEYVWYGKFLIDNTKYQKLKEKFHFFNKKI